MHNVPPMFYLLCCNSCVATTGLIETRALVTGHMAVLVVSLSNRFFFLIGLCFLCAGFCLGFVQTDFTFHSIHDSLSCNDMNS